MLRIKEILWWVTLKYILFRLVEVNNKELRGVQGSGQSLILRLIYLI